MLPHTRSISAFAGPATYLHQAQTDVILLRLRRWRQPRRRGRQRPHRRSTHAGPNCTGERVAYTLAHTHTHSHTHTRRTHFTAFYHTHALPCVFAFQHIRAHARTPLTVATFLRACACLEWVRPTRASAVLDTFRRQQALHHAFSGRSLQRGQLRLPRQPRRFTRATRSSMVAMRLQRLALLSLGE